MQTQFKTAEEWRDFESQIVADPQNLALCVAHVGEARANSDDKEFYYRVLALRATARRIKPTMDSSDLKERQKLRWNFYEMWLKNWRTKMEKRRKNPNYKSLSQRKAEREKLIYIRYCQRTDTPNLRRQISMVWDKSRGHAVAVDETIYPNKRKIGDEKR